MNIELLNKCEDIKEYIDLVNNTNVLNKQRIIE